MEREVVYEELSVRVAVGDDAITVSQAKKLLGWEEEGSTKFKSEYALKDKKGVKVRCHNNVTNRPIYKPVYETLRQEILRGRWRFNGEPIIVGETGLILNGQHTLLALILAAQEVEDNPGKWEHWEDKEPTMDKLIVFGVQEGDEVVNTMDTCKPRSLADVIYRSEYFADMGIAERRVVSRMTDHAIRLVWYRTGTGKDAFAPRRTHSESIDFLNRHPKLLECVRFINDEDEETHAITKVITPGYASALLYLMGSSQSDPEEYSNNEDELNWDNWESACNFWILIGSGSGEMSGVRESFKNLVNDGMGSVAGRCSLIAKCWHQFVSEDSVTDAISLEYAEDSNGYRQLAEYPAVGGIDVGNPKDKDTSSQESGAKPRKKTARKKTTKKVTKKTVKKKSTKKKTPRKKSRLEKVWVAGSTPEEHWYGYLVGTRVVGDKKSGKHVGEVKVADGFAGAGKIIEVPMDNLRKTKPA